MPLRRSAPLGALATTLAVAASGAACNLIAGINEGVLVDAGADGRATSDGGLDAGTHGDGSRGDGQSHDASALDATTDHAAPQDGPLPDSGHDGGLPEAAPPVITCTLQGSASLVDDLAKRDAASPRFGPHVYVAPTSNDGGFYVITQVQGDDTEFIAYSVQVNGGTATAQTWPSQPLSGVQLLDVLTTGSGQQEAITALITHTLFGGGGGNFTGLELVPLPSSFMGGEGMPAQIQGFIGNGVSQGKIVAIPPNDAGATIAYVAIDQGPGPSTDNLVVGTGPGLDGGVPPVNLYTGPSDFNLTSNEAFFASGGNLYTLMNELDVDGGIDGGELDYVVPQDLAGVTLAGSLAPPTGKGTLIAAKPSTAEPGKVVVLGAVLEGSGAVFYGATVPPSQIPTMTLGAPPFTKGSSIALSAAPFSNSSSAWTGDDFVSVSASSDGSSLVLLWLAPDGRVVASSTVPIPMIEGPLVSTAVQFDQFLSEGAGSNFQVAWVEQGSVGGVSLPQRLYAAEIVCLAVAGGG